MNTARALFIFSTLIFHLCFTKNASGQSVTCPVNIGFEQGSFNNWVCSYGYVMQNGDLDLSYPGLRAHEIIDRNAGEYDPYGNFPRACPNGSGYSIQLGDDNIGAQAERVSYFFNVPVGASSYSIIYHYAVVLQDPSHNPYQQPKFRTEVFNVTDNEPVDCPSFEFVSGSYVPGFLQAAFGDEVYYKPWAAVTLNLYGYAGKTVRIDFTANDCSQGGHFGYAYLDIDEDCASPIKGNTYCGSPSSITLKGPYGFDQYKWFDETLTTPLGTGMALVLTPPPPNGTVLALVLYPYPGLGCQDTLYTTINSLPDLLTLTVKDTVTGCITPGANLLDPSVTAGSTPGLKYGYYIDPVATIFIEQPDRIKISGKYYINASNSVGCNITKPVFVKITGPPVLMVADTVSGCSPPGVDLTAAFITAGSDAGLNYTYWNDSALTSPVVNPAAINADGAYYIKGTFSSGCFSKQPVQVKIARMQLSDASGCGVVDLEKMVNALGEPGFNYSYWTDASLTSPVTTPASVTTSGSYYISGVHTTGCRIVKNINVTVKPYPAFTVSDPPSVNYPETIDLFSTVNPRSAYEYSFWKDAAATVRAFRPEATMAAGTYYAKATSAQGCSVVKSIKVNVIPPPLPEVKAVNAFTPNGDGINEQWRVEVKGVVKLNNITIFNRWGKEVFWTKNIHTPWDGRFNGSPLPIGTYYWTFDGTDTYRGQKVLASGSITILR